MEEILEGLFLKDIQVKPQSMNSTKINKFQVNIVPN